jgi:hypothetical protein
VIQNATKEQLHAEYRKAVEAKPSAWEQEERSCYRSAAMAQARGLFVRWRCDALLKTDNWRRSHLPGRRHNVRDHRAKSRGEDWRGNCGGT